MIRKMLSTRIDTLVSIDVSLLILRVSAAFLMFYNHGLSKLTRVMNGEFNMNPIGIGPEASTVLSAFAEGICALLILFGLWTRLAAIPLVINMLVAVFAYHIFTAGDPLARFETAVLFLIIFIVLMFTGGGKYSMDAKLYGRSRV